MLIGKVLWSNNKISLEYQNIKQGNISSDAY